MAEAKNITVEDLLKPLTDQGYDIQMSSDMTPTFKVKYDGKEKIFVIEIGNRNLMPTPEGIINLYTDISKELEKQINAYDWEK